ncbi:MAG: hypothetical protein ACRER4_01710 [Steroidobacteraceae bacterium]
MTPRIFLTAVVAGLVCAQALAATPPAAPAGPWAKVPALPTACYAEQDHWSDQYNAAIEAVQADHERQNEANTAVEQRLQSVMQENPMAMAQALQQAMMSDPGNAQKIMQQLTQTGEQAQTEIPGQAQKDAQFKADAQALIKQYNAALEKAFRPGDARWTALKKKGGYEPDAIGPGETGVADWIWAEWDVILKDWKAGYQANCAVWFNTTGPMHAFMKRYKDYLVNERIPTEKRLIDQPRLDQYQMMNVSTTGWRTTSDYDAVENYLRVSSEVFAVRKASLVCEIDCR